MHFLSDPPSPLEWTNIYPSDRQFAKLRRVPKSKEVKIREINYKTERVYGFLSGIQLKFTCGFETEMFETALAREEHHEEYSVAIDTSCTVTTIKVRYEEFPDRNVYIHGIYLDGINKEGHTISLFNQTFLNYRGREETFQIPEGHSIVGLQVNSKSDADHISRLGFVLWGPGPHARVSKKAKQDKSSQDARKDLLMNLVFMCVSLVPVSVAIYFITVLNKHLQNEALWLPDCDEELQDSIINRLEWNRSYFYLVGVVTLLRMPQWFLQRVELFRKLAIWMWFLAMVIGSLNLTSMWLVNNVVSGQACSEAVL